MTAERSFQGGGSRPIPKAGAVVLLGAGALLCFWPAVSGATALLAGALLGLLRVNAWSDRTRPLATRLLQVAVVGLGAGMNLATIWAVGVNSLGTTLLGIGGTFALGLWLGRRIALSRDLSILLTAGTAICGGSAIAAIAGVLQPRAEETTVALATIFMLNAVALMVFPPLGHLLHLGQHQFGVWAALAIHDTSSVVGAGAAYGAEALGIATTVKLTRALWIAPAALAIGWAVRRSRSSGRPAGRISPPWFIFGFVAVAALVSYLPVLAEPGVAVFELAKRLLVVALFLIGTNLSIPMLHAVGWRPLAFGATLWSVVSLTSLAAILLGWIR